MPEPRKSHPEVPSHRRIVGDADLIAYLGGAFTLRKLRDLRYKRLIPYFSVGRQSLYDLDEINAWIDSQRVGAER